MVQILKDGKLVPSALKGIDVAKLNNAEKLGLHNAMQKSAAGGKMSINDLRAVTDAITKGK